jgi:hypothetical protein
VKDEERMGTLSSRAAPLLAACTAIGAMAAACSDLLGITAFTPAGEEAGAPPPSDGSSSSGSSSGGMVDSSSSSGSGSGSGSSSGSEGGGPVIVFRGYATASDPGIGDVQVLSPVLNWPQSAGDLIVLLINYDRSLTLSEVSDTSGNVYARFGTPVINAAYSETMYYCLDAKAAASGANIVTVKQSAPSAALGDYSVNAFGFGAPGRTWAQDVYSNNSQYNVNAVNTGPVTTNYADEVLVAGTGVDNVVVAGSGGNWVTEPVDGLGDLQEYLIVDSVQTNLAATFMQQQTKNAVSQLGTFVAKP